MAIAPIDLQALYSQMGHLAKTASDMQNGPHLAQQLQEAKLIQRDAEKAKTVSKAADNQSKTMIVGKDGRQQNQQERENSSSNNNSEEEQKAPVTEIREAYLGNHINIES